MNEEVDSISVISLALQCFLPFCFGFCKQGHTIAEHCLTCSLQTTDPRGMQNYSFALHAEEHRWTPCVCKASRGRQSLLVHHYMSVFSAQSRCRHWICDRPQQAQRKHEDCNTNTRSRTNHMAIIFARQSAASVPASRSRWAVLRSAQSQRIQPLGIYKIQMVLNHLPVAMPWQSGLTLTACVLISVALVLKTVILEMKRANNSCYAFCLLY